MRAAISVFYTASGKPVDFIRYLNERPMKYPLKQMNMGDWFEVSYDDCIAGNVTGYCSMWGKLLDRQFQTRTVYDRKGKPWVRVTRVK